jgi:hypothetical protein
MIVIQIPFVHPLIDTHFVGLPGPLPLLLLPPAMAFQFLSGGLLAFPIQGEVTVPVMEGYLGNAVRASTNILRRYRK